MAVILSSVSLDLPVSAVGNSSQHRGNFYCANYQF